MCRDAACIEMRNRGGVNRNKMKTRALALGVDSWRETEFEAVTVK